MQAQVELYLVGQRQRLDGGHSTTPVSAPVASFALRASPTDHTRRQRHRHWSQMRSTFGRCLRQLRSCTPAHGCQALLHKICDARTNMAAVNKSVHAHIPLALARNVSTTKHTYAQPGTCSLPTQSEQVVRALQGPYQLPSAQRECTDELVDPHCWLDWHHLLAIIRATSPFERRLHSWRRPYTHPHSAWARQSCGSVFLVGSGDMSLPPAHYAHTHTCTCTNSHRSYARFTG